MEAFCLRVSKSVAGKTFPFDRVYLVKYSDREVIERLFRYALVMSAEGKLLELLQEVPPGRYTNRTFDRDDETSATDKLSKKQWLGILASADWLMVVPILPKWINKSMPRYLVAANWYAKRTKFMGKKKGRVAVESREPPFTSRSFLQTPLKKIRPICVMCPRWILHQNGECQIGEKICFETLPLGLLNHFEEAEQLPDATPNIKELEEYELLEGESMASEIAISNTKTTKDLLRIIHE